MSVVSDMSDKKASPIPQKAPSSRSHSIESMGESEPKEVDDVVPLAVKMVRN